MIKGTTKLLGVIGHPIAHSLSPAMHNAAISHLGVDFVYLAFPVKPEDLKAALLGFRAIGLQGFSITIPHKQAILPLLSEVSPIARAIGAVNTVYLTEKGWCGTNTDVEGFLAPLQTPPTPPYQGGAVSFSVDGEMGKGGDWERGRLGDRPNKENDEFLNFSVMPTTPSLSFSPSPSLPIPPSFEFFGENETALGFRGI